MNEGYTTPEGFWIAKPLLLPDVRSFGELFSEHRPWDSEAMSHRSGVIPRPELCLEPRYIAQWKVISNIADIARLKRSGKLNEVGPYCRVQDRHGRGWSLAVTASDVVMEALADRIVTDDDHLSFSIMIHAERDRALVICNHGHIIGSIWLAYIAVDTIPDPWRARDERYADLSEAMKVNERRVMRRNHVGGRIELWTIDDEPKISAIIEPDGSATLTWADGSQTTEGPR